MGVNITSIHLLFSFIAVIFIALSSIKLVRVGNIPGAWLIFSAVIGTFITAFIPLISTFVLLDESEYLLEVAVSSIDALLFLLGAYGFWLLAYYSISKSANK